MIHNNRINRFKTSTVLC